MSVLTSLVPPRLRRESFPPDRLSSQTRPYHPLYKVAIRVAAHRRAYSEFYVYSDSPPLRNNIDFS